MSGRLFSGLQPASDLANQRWNRCHPRYLGVKAHAALSKPGTFDGLRIHTDEIMEVIARISPSTLTIAIVSIPVYQDI